MGKRRKAPEPTPATGLSAKLVTFFAYARRAKKAKVPGSYGLPRNGSNLAEWLTTERRQPIARQSVQDWIDGKWSPGQEFVPHLEALLGAPWWWIVSPATSWPPSEDDRAVFRLAVAPEAASDRAAVAAFLRARDAQSKRGQP